MLESIQITLNPPPLTVYYVTVREAIIEISFFRNVIQINSEMYHQLNTYLLFILVVIHKST